MKLASIIPAIIYRTFIHHLLSDELHIKILFRLRLGYWLDLKSPKTFNEKLQWLKLYDRKPEYTQMADKFAVREYIAKTIGEEYLIPLLGVWNKFNEIDFEKLPNKFVLKCTHNSGGNIVCTDKNTFDIASAGRKINRWLKHNYFYSSREWPYKNIKPRIIAEKYMVDESDKELKDYKIFCFNGEPKMIQVDFNRFKGHKRNLYSLQWEYQPFSLKFPTDPDMVIQKPEPLELMLKIAKNLSAGKIHVRVDLYVIRSKVYFGELTFYHGSGCEIFYPPEWDKLFGDWITLPTLTN